MDKQANASAESKKLQAYPQTTTVVAHLLLPNRAINLNQL